MKKHLAKYLLYIYLTFIKDENEEIYKKWAIPIVKSIIFVRSIYIWILSIILFPVFIIGMKIDSKIEDVEKYIEKILNIKNIKNIIN